MIGILPGRGHLQSFPIYQFKITKKLLLTTISLSHISLYIVSDSTDLALLLIPAHTEVNIYSPYFEINPYLYRTKCTITDDQY